MTRTLASNFFTARWVSDHLAPSEWLLGIVKSLTGIDVMRELVVPFVGQWGNVNTYGEALMNASRCLEVVSADVTAISSELGKNWQGLGADAARTNLASIAASLWSDSETQAELGMRYRELATAMQCAQVAAEMLLKAVLDTAIEIAMWAAAGTSTSQTRVGEVLGYGMATYKTAYLLQLLEEWSRLVSTAREEAERFLGQPGCGGGGRSGDGRSGDGRSGDGRSGDGRSGDGRSGDGRSGDGRPSGGGDRGR